MTVTANAAPVVTTPVVTTPVVTSPVVTVADITVAATAASPDAVPTISEAEVAELERQLDEIDQLLSNLEGEMSQD